MALITDEGLDGLNEHLINETAVPIDTRLEHARLRDGARKVARASKDMTLEAHRTARIHASDLLGHIFDFTDATDSVHSTTMQP
ncbi:hypothetical protein [Burkholderia sp. S171]|uniref:hypothetical protein n=1 Tax=Burkholderia sp. S171 TaxID=1641860 RepID=UPI00131D302D|nr:hypothetical protein [Burkholderia sp. S171]